MREAARKAREGDRSFGFPSRGEIIDLSGRAVDATGWIWRLNHVGRSAPLDWSKFPIRNGELLEASTRYIARLVKAKSSDLVVATFQALMHLRHAPSLMDAAENDEPIPASFFSELRTHFGEASEWRLHHIRHWFRSCAEMGYAAFPEELALELDARVIGGNRKGHAVLSLDPEEGPLNDLEFTALVNALNADEARKRLALRERAALWLFLAFGCNPLQVALLREEDLSTTEANGVGFAQLRIPRIKKRSEGPRTEFRSRRVTGGVEKVVRALIDENRARRDRYGWDPSNALALFVRDEPRTGDENGMADYDMHMFSNEIASLVRRAASKLGVVSPRTGEPLSLSPRRLRYTFATRLVREGASQAEVADALDHSDLQNVRVYFDVKSDIVVSLDKAMALALAPVAQAFLGKIVSEAGLTADDAPGGRIVVQDRASGEKGNIGGCGKHSFCGLLAPIACYTCCEFRPWIDAPHEMMLDQLLADRERRQEAGLDGRIVGLHDATILAVAEVIQRIAQMRPVAA